jgi:hypothetical protein
MMLECIDEDVGLCLCGAHLIRYHKVTMSCLASVAEKRYTHNRQIAGPPGEFPLRSDDRGSKLSGLEVVTGRFLKKLWNA